MDLQGDLGLTVLLGLAATNSSVKSVKNLRNEGSRKMPVVTIEASPGLRLDKKKKMLEKITAAIDEAYEIGDTLIFIHEDVPENVGMNGTLQSDNPKLLATLKRISA
jgi:phenylpyruvate tautomerase PptA (4-oxalocrotonate tautomerase family)